MWLTKNEKKVLKFLLDDAKLSDTSIANKLNISSQAVGRIRRKLEEEVIEGYTLNIDLQKIGINILATCKAKINKDDEVSRSDIEKMLDEEPHVLMLCDLIGEEFHYLMLTGFESLRDLKDFFKFDAKGVIKHLTCKDMIISTCDCVGNYNPNALIKKRIDNLGLKSVKFRFK